MFLLVLVTILLIIIGLYIQRLHKYKVIDEYPGPSTLEIIRFMVLPKSTAASYKYLLFLSEKYGPVVKLWLKPFRPTLLVADQRFIKNILLSKEHVNKAGLFDLLIPLAGSGLGTLKDLNIWKQERKIFAHVFTNQLITEYTSTFKNHAVKMADSIRNVLNEPVNSQQLMLKFGLNIVFEMVTTEDISNQDERVNEFMESLKLYFHIFFDRINSLYKINDTLFKLTKDYETWNRTSRNLKVFIERPFKRVWELRKKTEQKQKDFIDLLLETGLSYDRVLDNVRTFILAGSETVSTCVSFTLYELSKRPHMQERIYNEYISILGEEKNVFAEFRDVQKMTYTECVIKESLRMYPPIPMIYRSLMVPTDIDGKSLPADIDVIFSFIASHAINFENPLKFDPERFLPENNHKLPPHGYGPFSFGPRDCLGKTIGIVECKFLLSYVVRHFTIHPVADHKLDLVGELSLTSKTGVPVIFRERTK